jgi:hypothetical protein
MYRFLSSVTMRSFAKARKLPPKIPYNDRGEYVFIRWENARNFIRGSVLGLGAYLYFLSTLKPDSALGKYKWYSLAVFGGGALFATRLFTKFVNRLVLVENGKAVRVERYPLFGFGHMKLRTVYHWDIEHITPVSWFSRIGIGRGFYKLQWKTKSYGRET